MVKSGSFDYTQCECCFIIFSTQGTGVVLKEAVYSPAIVTEVFYNLGSLLGISDEEFKKLSPHK